MVVGRRFYAERRSRAADRAHYAFGEDGRGAWLETAGLARAADEAWRAEARTRAAIFGLRFLHPGVGDDADLVDDAGRVWDYAYRPVGGRTVTLRIDEADGRPVSWDSQDAFLRLVTCDALRWDERDGHQVPIAGTCHAGGCSTRACAPPSRSPSSRPRRSTSRTHPHGPVRGRGAAGPCRSRRRSAIRSSSARRSRSTPRSRGCRPCRWCSTAERSTRRSRATSRRRSESCRRARPRSSSTRRGYRR